jgi:hypothetical protein
MVNKDYPPGAPTFYTVDRTHRLTTQFAANDPRREPFVGLGWTYDMRHGNATTIVNGSPALWTATQSHDMARQNVQTWVGLPCYKAIFEEVPYPIAPGYENVEWIDDYFLGLEAQPFRPAAEITFGGIMPYAFFQVAYGPNAAFILGVTYSFSFYDSSGNPTDIDHNGMLDTYWTEIYFNGLYAWGDTQDYFAPYLDLGTVGLHESGHAFGLAHDGKDFDNHGGFHLASYNIMTQIYLPQRSVSGVPTASFCSIYGRWP